MTTIIMIGIAILTCLFLLIIKRIDTKYNPDDKWITKSQFLAFLMLLDFICAWFVPGLISREFHNQNLITLSFCSLSLIFVYLLFKIGFALSKELYEEAERINYDKQKKLLDDEISDI